MIYTLGTEYTTEYAVHRRFDRGSFCHGSETWQQQGPLSAETFFIVDRCEAKRGVAVRTIIDKIRLHEGFLPAFGFFFQSFKVKLVVIFGGAKKQPC